MQIVPVNVNAPIAIASPGAGGDVDQSNDASSKAGAGNVAIVHQDVDQTQTGSQGGDKPHGCGCNDKGDKATTRAASRARIAAPSGQSATQRGRSGRRRPRQRPCSIVPVNVNAPIAIASPGAGGDVDQSNDASSKAGAGNVAIVHQDIDQTSKGDRPHKPEHPSCGCNDKGSKGPDGDKPHGKGDDGQRATNTVDQDATAHAKTVQLVPVNLNAPVAKPKPQPGCGCEPQRDTGKDKGTGKGKPYGHRGGDVNQSNRATSGAWAGNLAVVGQDIDQTGNGNASQTAINRVDQDANARAKTVQLLPINANLPASGSPVPAPLLVPDDTGCGCQGPGGPPWPGPGGGDVDQTNSASSRAGALNVAFVDQAIQQAAGGRR